MAPKLKDIAKRARLSTAAVSLALNGKAGVSRDTVDRVMKIARELNYEIPRGKQERLRTIRFVQIHKPESVVDPIYNAFIADYFKGLTSASRSHGYKLEVNSFPDADLQEVIASLSEDGPAGAVVLGAGLWPNDVRRFEGVPTPLVFIDVCYEFIAFDFVDMNNEDSVYQIVSHLRARGHSRIGLVQGAVQTPNFGLREAGFRRALAHFSLPFDEEHRFVIPAETDEAMRVMDAALRGCHRLPTAVFCVNDTIAYNCMQAFAKYGLKVPADISVVGFDNLPSGKFMEPSLTTIDISKQLMGERAFFLLMERIRLGMDKPTERVLLNGTLIPRKSVRSIG